MHLKFSLLPLLQVYTSSHFDKALSNSTFLIWLFRVLLHCLYIWLLFPYCVFLNFAVLLQPQNVQMFLPASTRLQNALNFSFGNWAICRNSKFCITRFSVGLLVFVRSSGLGSPVFQFCCKRGGEKEFVLWFDLLEPNHFAQFLYLSLLVRVRYLMLSISKLRSLLRC